MTASVAVSGNGQPTTPWSPSVRRSAALGNTLLELGDGLFVGTQTPAPVVIADTPSIDMSGDGTGGSPISAALRFRPFIERAWQPRANSVTGAGDAPTSGQTSIVVPAKGWVDVTFAVKISSGSFNETQGYVEITPLQVAGTAPDTTITGYNEGRAFFYRPAGAVSWMDMACIAAAWYIPAARTLRLGLKYSSSDLISINTPGGVDPGPRVVIRYTPDLT